jgi:hypothetical protein
MNFGQAAARRKPHQEHGVHGGAVGAGQEDAADQHRSSAHHGAPLAPHAVGQVAQPQLPHDDAPNLQNKRRCCDPCAPKWVATGRPNCGPRGRLGSPARLPGKDAVHLQRHNVMITLLCMVDCGLGVAWLCALQLGPIENFGLWQSIGAVLPGPGTARRCMRVSKRVTGYSLGRSLTYSQMSESAQLDWAHHWLTCTFARWRAMNARPPWRTRLRVVDRRQQGGGAGVVGAPAARVLFLEYGRQVAHAEHKVRLRI